MHPRAPSHCHGLGYSLQQVELQEQTSGSVGSASPSSILRSTNSDQSVAFQFLPTPDCDSTLLLVVLPWWNHLGSLFLGSGSGSCCGTGFACCSAPLLPAQLCAAVQHQRLFLPFQAFLPQESQRALWDKFPVSPGNAGLGRSRRTPKPKQRGGTAKCKLSLHKGAAHQKPRKSWDVFFPRGTTRSLSTIQIYPATLIEQNNDVNGL